MCGYESVQFLGYVSRSGVVFVILSLTLAAVTELFPQWLPHSRCTVEKLQFLPIFISTVVFFVEMYLFERQSCRSRGRSRKLSSAASLPRLPGTWSLPLGGGAQSLDCLLVRSWCHGRKLPVKWSSLDELALQHLCCRQELRKPSTLFLYI